MQAHRRFALGLALAASLFAGCAQADAGRARPDPRGAADAAEQRHCVHVLHGQWWQRSELYFGRNSPLGTVSEAAFQGFLDGVVTPLFPDGLTVIDAKGQYRASAERPPEKEDSKLLVLFYPFDKRLNDAVEEIRSRYKQQFQQQSVLRVDQRSCVSF